MRSGRFHELRRQPSRRSAVLILTLAIVVILTILLVAFVSVVTRDRGATQSYSQSLRAEQIGLGGLDQVVAQIQAEIMDTNLSATNGSSPFLIYVPINNTNAVPQKMLPLPSNLATITKLSTNGIPLYISSSASAAQMATNFASLSSTASASVNGRSMSIARWNKPMLATSTNNFPAPDWVVVTRQGPQAFNAYNSALATDSLGNGSYAVGRYAYVVYDTSGLIDVNVAGYPSSYSAGAAGKGSLPWADLTRLTNTATPAITQTPDIDNLVAWRNAASAGSYAAYVTNTWATNGFMQVAPGDTTFLSRQDLIQYAQKQNTDLTNALPFLTTFSREINEPTWEPSMTTTNCPANNYNYTNYQYTPTGGTNDNVFVLNPRVQSGHTFTRRSDGTTSVVGEPLIKHRFDLSKLALLEKLGTVGLSDQDKSDIQYYFGLDLVLDSNGLYRHWSYPTTSRNGNSSAGILTLDEVAALGREPDFFELLQAGILQGSVGYNYPANSGLFPSSSLTSSVRGDYRAAGTMAYWTSPDSDTKITYQILRIGANIIDQWDADSYPTTITFQSSVGVAEDVYGIEDLPYINELFVKPYTSVSNPTPLNSTSYTNYPYLYCELWNPHQVPAHIVTANYPAGFQISPAPHSAPGKPADWYLMSYQGGGADSGCYWYWNGTTWTSNTLALGYFSDLPNSGNIEFSYSPATDYRQPSLITNGTSALPPVWGSGTNLAAWVLPPMPMPDPANKSNGVSWSTALGTLWHINVATSTILRIQFRDPSNNSLYHTYGTFVGMDDANSYLAGGNGAPLSSGWYMNEIQSGPSGQGDTNANFVTSVSYPKSDPRTSRYGAGFYGNSTTSASKTSPGLSLSPAANSTYIETGFSPFNVPGNYRLDLWAVNDTSVSTAPYNSNYYPNADMVYRPGDARYTTNSAGGITSAPLFYTGDTVHRPVILNRPFQSIGELGYSFRDEPWKTLNLFGQNSADAALLDLFTIGPSPQIVAGRVNPNTPYPQVMAALISGAAQAVVSGTTVSNANANILATNIVGASTAAPFMNRAALASGAFMTNAAVISAFTGIKTQEEAAIRAVADSANTRTWNFLIDIVAQSGQYPKTATSLDNFVVTGERRYWLHIAIDRYTGQIVDKQLEVVNE